MPVFRVKINLPTNVLDQPSRKAETILAQQILEDTMPYTPLLTGSLSQRSYTDGGTVVYPGPYARYLYYGKLMVDPNTGSSYAPKGGTKVLTDRNLVFTDDFNPDAQDHWFEASKAENKKKWEEIAGKVVKKALER